MGNFTNSEDPDEMLHKVTFHQGLQYRDQTCFSMHKHLLDPEGGVETRA